MATSKPVRWRSACNQCHAAKVRCSGNKTGCDRCANLDFQCVYAISRVGKVPGNRSRKKTESHQTAEHLSLSSSRDPDCEPAPYGQQSRQHHIHYSQDSNANNSLSPLQFEFPDQDGSIDSTDVNDDGVSSEMPGAADQMFSLSWDQICNPGGESSTNSGNHDQNPNLGQGYTPRPMNNVKSADLPCHEMNSPMNIDLQTEDYSFPDLFTQRHNNNTTHSTGHRLDYVGNKHDWMQKQVTAGQVGTSNENNAYCPQCRADCENISHVMIICNKIVGHLQRQIQIGINALDVVMYTTKATLAVILRILTRKSISEHHNCRMLIVIAIDQIITLFELTFRASCGETAAIEGLPLRSKTLEGNVLPNLRFGVFQINKDEQMELLSYLFKRELGRSFQVLTILRVGKECESDPCKLLEERLHALLAALEK